MAPKPAGGGERGRGANDPGDSITRLDGHHVAGVGRGFRSESLSHRWWRHVRDPARAVPGLSGACVALALVSLYGLVLDASQIEKQIGALSEVLPAETQQLLVEQLHELVEASRGALVSPGRLPTGSF
jgi:hypothetical protein